MEFATKEYKKSLGVQDPSEYDEEKKLKAEVLALQQKYSTKGKTKGKKRVDEVKVAMFKRIADDLQKYGYQNVSLGDNLVEVKTPKGIYNIKITKKRG